MDSNNRYVTRVSEIEARKVTSNSVYDVAHWCGGRVVEEIDPFNSALISYGINVATFNGTKRASENDYVVRRDTGEFDVEVGTVFEAKYIQRLS